MEKRLIPNIYGKIKNRDLVAYAPGSKSITNRAFLLAALSDGECTLNGVLMSDDTRHFKSCLTELGFEVSVDENTHIAKVKGMGGFIPKKCATIDVGSAGTAARFLAALLGMSNGEYTLNSSEQMKKRPMKALTDSLSDIGCKVSFLEAEGHFPFVLNSNGVNKDIIDIDIDISSQFLSAFLIAAPILNRDIDIRVSGTHGLAYVDMTVKMMNSFGVQVIKNGNIYSVKAGQSYKALNYDIEPDASAAAYFYAMSPILSINAKVPGIKNNSLQGDIRFLDVLCEMGCTKAEDESGNLILQAPAGELSGGEFDLSAFSDQAITLAAVSIFANAPVTIKGIAHIRAQECDRVNGICKALESLGIEAKANEDSITIFPGTPHAGEIETFEDHRMSMGFALPGLRTDGVVILDPMCCRKTFENYYRVLDEVIKKLTE